VGIPAPPLRDKINFCADAARVQPDTNKISISLFMIIVFLLNDNIEIYIRVRRAGITAAVLCIGLVA
jgi:hypothetical protein